MTDQALEVPLFYFEHIIPKNIRWTAGVHTGYWDLHEYGRQPTPHNV